ncbi:hypothetical protein BKA93DRAFT_32722 [Sparassis latifolia]
MTPETSLLILLAWTTAAPSLALAVFTYSEEQETAILPPADSTASTPQGLSTDIATSLDCFISHRAVDLAIGRFAQLK